MGFPSFKTAVLFLSIALLWSCVSSEKKKHDITVYQTSQAGDRLTKIAVAPPNKTGENLPVLTVQPQIKFQTYYGFGASFTESSAWNLATLPTEDRLAVMTQLFSPTEGAGFSLTRTHINSSDYANGHYSYVEDQDEDLSSFSINEDLKGFSGDENDQVSGIPLATPNYDLIPMIQEAQNIPGANFKIIASPWSPPSWMKTKETAKMTNGYLQPKYHRLWAEYLSKYITAYAEQNIPIWAITPQNEPLHAHDARWDSNGFTAEQGRDFLRDYLGPQLVKDGHLNLENLNEGLKVLIYDHNKSALNAYVTTTYLDKEATKYAWGTALHWYASSSLEANNWYAEEIDQHLQRWPDKKLIHTESSIDIDAQDPIGQYWRESTDYAGRFVPFDTYAYDILTDVNHGVQGYVEWCMILSHEGKPNPYDNFNSAPVLINPTTHEVTYTPLYYLLSHFSKFIRPGAKRVATEGNLGEGVVYTAAENPEGSIAVVIFNRTQEEKTFWLNIEGETHYHRLAPRALQTLFVSKKENE